MRRCVFLSPTTSSITVSVIYLSLILLFQDSVTLTYGQLSPHLEDPSLTSEPAQSQNDGHLTVIAIEFPKGDAKTAKQLFAFRQRQELEKRPLLNVEKDKTFSSTTKESVQQTPQHQLLQKLQQNNNKQWLPSRDSYESGADLLSLISSQSSEVTSQRRSSKSDLSKHQRGKKHRGRRKKKRRNRNRRNNRKSGHGSRKKNKKNSSESNTYDIALLDSDRLVTTEDEVTEKRKDRRKKNRSRGKGINPISTLDHRPIHGSNSAVVIAESMRPMKEQCFTKPMQRSIQQKGCKKKKVTINFCYGQCNSFYIPEVWGKGTGEPSFVSCGFCRPKETKTKIVTLHCKNRKGTHWKKKRRIKILYVSKCRCMEQSVGSDWRL